MDIEKMKKCMEYQKSVGLRLSDGITDSELNWLIEQAEVLREIADTWVAIETNGTIEDAYNFYTIVQDILTKQHRD